MSVKGPLLATATRSIPSADRREYHARKCDFRNPQANRTKPEGMVRMSWCEELCLALTKPMGEQGGQTRNRSCQRLSELFLAHGCYRRPHGPRGTQRSGIVRAAKEGSRGVLNGRSQGQSVLAEESARPAGGVPRGTEPRSQNMSLNQQTCS